MCKRYVNATMALFSDIKLSTDGIPQSFIGLFDTVDYKVDKNKQINLPPFYILTRFTFLGTKSEDLSTPNPMRDNTRFHIKIRLTKCSSEDKEQQYIDLDQFVIDIANETPSRACFDYLNVTHITQQPNLVLEPGDGKYVIKVLIRDEDEEQNGEKYTIQSMYPLLVRRDVTF